MHHSVSGHKSTYDYNIRNWLTGINSTNLKQSLYYNSGNGTALYNGNISSMTWQAGTESTVRGYKFSYDNLNRMTTGTYGEGTSISTNAGRFSENITSYDKNGNIKSLQRYGKTGSTTYGTIDNLTLEYNGNQLKYANDAATDPLYNGAFNFVNGSNSTGNEYIFDANGNLQQDFNKKITKVQYNLLNLPSTLQFTNGNRTDYVYSADGVKRRVTHQTAIASVSIPMGQITNLTSAQVSQTNTIDYCGNVIYENGNLSKILTEEGYITLSGSTPTYHYYLKDHLGNNRVVMNQSGTVEQVNHYYPFGGLFGEGTATSSQPYKYNGKELDRMHGLDWYDYEARMYDAALGRWHVVDALAEKYYSTSPYVYCYNNPIKYIDPDGRSGTIVGGLLGGIFGGYKAMKSGQNIIGGIAEGAVSGAIVGATVDLAVGATLATGGSIWLVAGVGALAGTAGGAVGGIAGDVAGQAATQIDEGNNVTISTENFANKAMNGAISGSISGFVGGLVGVGSQTLRNSSQTVQNTMSGNINTTATTLNGMGASAETTSAAVNQITKGMSEVGKKTANTTLKIEASTTFATELSSFKTENPWKKE